jgi:hypothetical protein
MLANELLIVEVRRMRQARRAIVAVICLLLVSACSRPTGEQASTKMPATPGPYELALRRAAVDSALRNGDLQSIRVDYCYLDVGMCGARYTMNVALTGAAQITIAGPCQRRTHARATFDLGAIAPMVELLPNFGANYPDLAMNNPGDEVDIVTKHEVFKTLGYHVGPLANLYARLDQFARDVRWSPPINFGIWPKHCGPRCSLGLTHPY